MIEEAQHSPCRHGEKITFGFLHYLPGLLHAVIMFLLVYAFNISVRLSPYTALFWSLSWT